MATAQITFREIEPGIAYEYAVIVNNRRIGRVRKEESAVYPFEPTGKWVADNCVNRSGGFATRQNAADWLLSWVRS
jgi:hypothetical protein